MNFVSDCAYWIQLICAHESGKTDFIPELGHANSNPTKGLRKAKCNQKPHRVKMEQYRHYERKENVMKCPGQGKSRSKRDCADEILIGILKNIILGENQEDLRAEGTMESRHSPGLLACNRVGSSPCGRRCVKLVGVTLIGWIIMVC